MRKIPVISSDTGLNAAIQAECSKFNGEFNPVFFEDAEAVLEFIKYDIPEIKILNFSDRLFDCPTILGEIRSDPWLHYGGIIAILEQEDSTQFMETLRGLNVIAVLSRSEFLANLGRLLRVIRQNKQILFQRELQQHLIKSISGEMVIDNDPLDITVYTNLLSNYLFSANLIGAEDRDKLHVALLELLVNAIEHGNCRIDYDEKTRWLEAQGDIMDLIRQKNRDPAIRARKVHFSYTIGPDRSIFTIKDEGRGFDWRARLASKQDRPGLHGMGMKIANLYMKGIRYNEQGNEVSFDIEHHKATSNLIPKIFANSKEVTFSSGNYICREGEESDVLYYIVSGTLYVYSRGKLMSALTPDDIFMGEMSFLLSNRRSATVVARGPATLIEISKQDFVKLIRDNPHYGIFLARLLAQRLARLNARTARLSAEYLKLKAAAPDEKAADCP
jgi:anti-sigma regulatory factor (Ser/Thr protein kinase)